MYITVVCAYKAITLFQHIEDAREFADKIIHIHYAGLSLDADFIGDTIAKAEAHKLDWLDISEQWVL